MLYALRASDSTCQITRGRRFGLIDTKMICALAAAPIGANARHRRLSRGAGECLYLTSMIDGGTGGTVLGEQFEVLDIIVGNRDHGRICIGDCVWIGGDAPVDPIDVPR